MVDRSKRQSLKSIGAMAAIPLVPAATLSAEALANNADASLNSMSLDNDLSISLLLDGKPAIRVTNNSDSLTILRRIQPGVMHVGDTTYDLNKALKSSAYAVRAGHSRLIPIDVASSTETEAALPHSFKKYPMRTASISSDNQHGRVLNNARAFYV